MISYSLNFNYKFGKILDFISIDSEIRAKNFAKELKTQIHSIAFMPYRFRKNQIFCDENIRDFIFKGYVVVFKISEEIKNFKYL